MGKMAAAIYRQQKVLFHFPVCCWIDWLLMIKNCLIESGPPCSTCTIIIEFLWQSIVLFLFETTFRRLDSVSVLRCRPALLVSVNGPNPCHRTIALAVSVGSSWFYNLNNCINILVLLSQTFRSHGMICVVPVAYKNWNEAGVTYLLLLFEHSLANSVEKYERWGQPLTWLKFKTGTSHVRVSIVTAALTSSVCCSHIVDLNMLSTART
jgi:hypothetical protein